MPSIERVDVMGSLPWSAAATDPDGPFPAGGSVVNQWTVASTPSDGAVNSHLHASNPGRRLSPLHGDAAGTSFSVAKSRCRDRHSHLVAAMDPEQTRNRANLAA